MNFPPPPLHIRPPPPLFGTPPPHCPPLFASATSPQPLRRPIAGHLDPSWLLLRNVSARWPAAAFRQLLRQLGAQRVHQLVVVASSGRPQQYLAGFGSPAAAFDVLWYLHQRQCAGRVLDVRYATGLEVRRLPAEPEAAATSSRRSQLQLINDQPANDSPAAAVAATREQCQRIAAILLHNPVLFGRVLRLMRRFSGCREATPSTETGSADDCSGDHPPSSLSPMRPDRSQPLQPEPATATDDPSGDLSDPESELSSAEDEPQGLPRSLKRPAPLNISTETRRPILGAKRARQMVQQFSASCSTSATGSNRGNRGQNGAAEVVAPAIRIHLAAPRSSDQIPPQLVDSDSAPLLRLSPAEMAAHPLFAGTASAPAPPNRRLYVKNVAKSVSGDQLRRLCQRFVGAEAAGGAGGAAATDEGRLPEARVQLFSSGRLKGQAFITFGWQLEADAEAEEDERLIAAAREARAQLHGLWLGGKPLVVAFGKQQRPPKTADPS